MAYFSKIFQSFTGFKVWVIVLIAFIVSSLASLSSFQTEKEDRQLYEAEFVQAPWAPPGWVFGPAWLFINIFLLLALQKIIKTVPRPKSLVVIQLFIWVIFFSFGFVYFNLRSPILATVWTLSDLILAIISITIAFRNKYSWAFLYLPLLLWTAYAGTVALYQALINSDPLFK